MLEVRIGWSNTNNGQRIKSKIGTQTSKWGGQRDSNPQQPEPQSGALPLSYGHRLEREIVMSRDLPNQTRQPAGTLWAVTRIAVLLQSIATGGRATTMGARFPHEKF